MPGDVSTNAAPSGVGAISGQFTATGQSSTFNPKAGRALNLSLGGAFTGSVQLERNFGSDPNLASTWFIVGSAMTAPASTTALEPEVGVNYRLNCTSYTSGTISYRLSQ